MPSVVAPWLPVVALLEVLQSLRQPAQLSHFAAAWMVAMPSVVAPWLPVVALLEALQSLRQPAQLSHLAAAWMVALASTSELASEAWAWMAALLAVIQLLCLAPAAARRLPPVVPGAVSAVMPLLLADPHDLTRCCVHPPSVCEVVALVVAVALLPSGQLEWQQA